MADSKISALTELAAADVDVAADFLGIVDTGASATKKVTPNHVFGVGTAGQIWETNSGATAAAWANRVTVSATQAWTAATELDFTGIPSWATNIVVMFVGFSTNGTSVPLIQLGDAGGPETSGYLGTGSSSAGSNTIGAATYTAGFGIGSEWAATNVAHGNIHLTRQASASFQWTCFGFLGQSDSARTNWTSGSKATSAALTQVRVTTVNGTDAGDAGTVSVMYW